MPQDNQHGGGRTGQRHGVGRGEHTAEPAKLEQRIARLEAAGVVDVVGEGVTDWAPGDEAMVLLAGGGYGRGEFKKVESTGPGKVPLCNLLLDIAQRMGIEQESFGTSNGTFS